MKKGNAALVLIVLIAFTAISWIGVVKGQVEDKAAYNEYLKQAANFEAKGIYIDALENYKKALELNVHDFELTMKVADMYYQLGDYQGFISSCDKAILLSSKKPEPYILKAEYYMSESQYSEAIKVVKEANRAIKDNESIKNLEIELSSKYIEKYVGFSSVKEWHIQDNVNYVAVEESSKWGMTLKDGSRKLKFVFDYIGAYDKESGVIPCAVKGVYYYIDEKGNKKLIGDKNYQFLGSFGNGLAPAQFDNKYGYIDTGFNESKFEFEFAGAFADNIAAVRKDGKWALINTKFENITGFDYDEILVDSNGFCSLFNIIIVRQGEKFVFLNHEGKEVSEQKFDGAQMPASNDGYIAVKIADKWGFANQNGGIVIEPKFQAAKSFSLGLAPYSENDRWGYVNVNGETVIEPKYFDAGVFAADGSAAVKNVSGWNFIVLCEYDK